MSKRWTEEENMFLREFYPDQGQAWCSKHLERSLASVRAQTSDLGLRLNRKGPFFLEFQARAAKSKIGHPAWNTGGFHHKKPMSAEQKARRSENTKAWIARAGHPRGALGMRHSDAMKAAMSERVKKQWRDPESLFNSASHRQGLSDRMAYRQASRPADAEYSRGRGGRRKDLNGMYFRSRWEANYARYLNWMKERGEIHAWEYEPDTFWFEKIKRGCRSYTPDFKIWDKANGTPRYVEVKGWMDQKSKTKLDRMQRYYPSIQVDVFSKQEYAQLKRGLSGVIVGWEYEGDQ